MKIKMEESRIDGEDAWKAEEPKKIKRVGGNDHSTIGESKDQRGYATMGRAVFFLSSRKIFFPVACTRIYMSLLKK